MQNQNNISYSAHKDFRKVFINKEKKELFGFRFKNLYWLIVILLVTFLSLGFANGSLKYLKMKMDDPFIKWVNVDVPYTMLDKIHEIKNVLMQKEVSDSFGYKTVTGNYEFSFNFRITNTKDRARYEKGRSLEPGNPLAKSILDEKNKIIGKSAFKEDEIGLIVTEKLLEKLGYKNAPHFLMLNYKIDSVLYNVPLPIIAVVKNLPNKNEFATTTFLYKKYYHSLSNPFDLRKTEYNTQLLYFIPNSKKSEKCKEDLIKFITEKYGEDAISGKFVVGDNSTYQKGERIHITLNKKIVNQIDEINENILSNLSKNYQIYRVYNYNLSNSNDKSRSYDQLSISFKTLDNIRQFQDFLMEKYKLKIDMSLIESKENYNFVTKLTKIILLFLILLSVISVILYVTNVLILHLEKIKKNIGTFKAFGLTNRTMKLIYARMITEFILIAIVISYVISFVLGKIGFIKLFLVLFKAKLEKGQTYFDLIQNQYAFISIILIFLFSVVAIVSRLNKMLSKTPGDLIYDRD